MTIKNQEALEDRARDLDSQGLNGFKFLHVDLYPEHDPYEAHMKVYFHNSHELANIISDPTDPKLILPVSGGHRILAGPATGQVKVESISGDPSQDYLVLKVSPVGDYSTYSLAINYQNIDPLFSEISFKFRPGCFNINCAPEWNPSPPLEEIPVIDYLTKDYDSFRHVIISAMMERVPNWKPTSEADLDQVLIDLISAAADELSDYQDRVMNEAYIGTARKRVSLARHARLMDYHIHHGNQASTWLALEIAEGEEFDLKAGFRVWAGKEAEDESAKVFLTKETQRVHSLLNGMKLYAWSGAVPALKSGSTTADLMLDTGGKTAADTVRDLMRSGTISYLLIEEKINPETAKVAGKNPLKRQVLRLLPGDQAAETLEDPFTDTYFLRVRWEEKDKLKHDYCFIVDCPEGILEGVSLFHGNLIKVYHGRPAETFFKEPTEVPADLSEEHFERTEKRGTICKLPDGLLAYRDTPPGGEIPPVSTLEVEVQIPGESAEKWEEVISLVHSDAGDESGDHFVVETDENATSLIRFGNGTNGKALPEGAVVKCTYQTGSGPEGNIGAEKLIHFDEASFPRIEKCWNPFDARNGRAPEPVEEIIRRVPEAYRYRQLRAVTLRDYEQRAEELEEISRASARYVWTGSWRAVRIAVDPIGGKDLDDELREKIALYLEPVKLLGEDMEIRPPLFVPLRIDVTLCIHPDYWVSDLKWILEQEFSDSYTPDGRMGFFHPDRWTFGQSLKESEIIGRIQTIKGIDHVVSVSMKRWDQLTPVVAGIVEVRANEIIQVNNDPDHMEEGFIFFDIGGGRG